MAVGKMEVTNLLLGYADKLKSSEKLLKSLERKAKTLAQKQADTDAQRLTLEAKIVDHKRDTAALLSERQDLHLNYMKAVYEQDVSEQRDIQSRRVEIDTALQEHGQSIAELNELLAGLGDFAEQSAVVAAQLDALAFGNALQFANELETALMSNQRTLESRQSDARKMLPSFGKQLYVDVRSAQDQDYARKVESEAKEQARLERVRQEKEERSQLSKSAVVDQDTGYLLGYNIKDSEGKVIRYEKVKRVPISS